MYDATLTFARAPLCSHRLMLVVRIMLIPWMMTVFTCLPMKIVLLQLMLRMLW